jgi:Trp operon repressor
MSEKWLPVVGYEDVYSVSNFGKIRREKPYKSTKVGRILVGGKNPQGYSIFGLYKNGTRHYMALHTIVTNAFLGQRPKDKVVNHKDGNKLNNNIQNLEYVTVKENNDHAKNTGLLRPLRGEDKVEAKLTEKNVKQMRSDYLNKIKSQKELTQEYGISIACVSRTVNRKSWQHI